jgi:hypothetical protein
MQMPKAKVTSPTIPTACFAPELNDNMLARYRELIENLDAVEQAELKDALLICLVCVEAWWELPVSKRTDGDRYAIKHRGTNTSFVVTPLEEQHVAYLWEVTPWMRELLAMEPLFDALPSGTICVGQKVVGVEQAEHKLESGVIVPYERFTKVDDIRVVDEAAYELRNAAQHLLWHAKEITLDREPLTQDKLPAA